MGKNKVTSSKKLARGKKRIDANGSGTSSAATQTGSVSSASEAGSSSSTGNPPDVTPGSDTGDNVVDGAVLARYAVRLLKAAHGIRGSDLNSLKIDPSWKQDGRRHHR
jgi:hypothetical protein